MLGIVRQHHGYVSAYSELGRGSTFRVYVPPVMQDVTVAATTELTPTIDTLHDTERLLVLKNDAGTRGFAVLSLRELGHEVHAASSSEDALRQLANPTFELDLLISDVILPKMNGRDLHHTALALRPTLKVFSCPVIRATSSSITV